MLDLARMTRVHCIGIGGIHVSAVAKLLASRGVTVTGSDTSGRCAEELTSHGIPVMVGHAAGNIPEDADGIIYSHAVPDENEELAEARRRGLLIYHSHAFLAEMFRDAVQVIVTGTHGKSTTTAMLANILIEAGADPTVVVGTKVPGFTDGNLRIGSSKLLIAEGDEYREHVLVYTPTVLVLNNAELDHTDCFSSLDEYLAMFRTVTQRVRDKGVIVWNRDDKNVTDVIARARKQLDARNVRLVSVGEKYADVMFTGRDRQSCVVRCTSLDMVFQLQIPGLMNIRNAAMAAAAASAVEPWSNGAIATSETIKKALESFTGVWRRFERVGTFRDCPVISDYAHHPTAVRETLAAAQQVFPSSRIVFCFQPHQRNRTKQLFQDFPASFDDADVLILSEIYDVPGREAAKDADISSQQLVDAVQTRDHEKGRSRIVRYAKDLAALRTIMEELVQPGDVILIAGAGDVDDVARQCVMRNA
jgi:UDP-N-acetylmuramate--alanine ligase